MEPQNERQDDALNACIKSLMEYESTHREEIAKAAQKAKKRQTVRRVRRFVVHIAIAVATAIVLTSCDLTVREWQTWAFIVLINGAFLNGSF